MNFDIEVIKRKMLVKYPFFGTVVANVEYKETDSIATLATDGKTIYYNPKFLAKLDISEQIFVFAHEVCHIAFNHILRSENKETKIWNIATDGVINQFLIRDGLKMVSRGVDIADAINYDAEQLYEKLLQEKQQNDENKQKENNIQSEYSQQSNKNILNKKNDINNNDVGHDTHSMWDEAVKKHKETAKKSDKESGLFEKIFNKKQINNEIEQNKIIKKDEIEQKQEDLTKIGEKEAFKENNQEKKRQLKKMENEIYEQVSCGAGKSTTSSIRRVKDIGYAKKSLIDWRRVLSETMMKNVDWSYKNAILENGVISATLEEQPISETEILLDTSGSVSTGLLRNFLKECKNLMKYSNIKVGCFDTEFYGFNTINNEDDINNMQFRGGGGTNFNVAVNAFSRMAENKIIFTDGFAQMPSMPFDAIWVVYGDTKINPVGGKVIYINNEQLSNLYFENASNKGRSR